MLELYMYKAQSSATTDQNIKYMAGKINTWTVNGEFISRFDLIKIGRQIQKVAICMQPWHREYPRLGVPLQHPQNICDELNFFRWRFTELADLFRSVGLTCPLIIFDCERWKVKECNVSYLLTLLDLMYALAKQFFPNAYVDWANFNYYASHLITLPPQLHDGYSLQLYRNNVDLKDSTIKLSNQTKMADESNKPILTYIGTGFYYVNSAGRIEGRTEQYPVENTKLLAKTIKTRYPRVTRAVFYPQIGAPNCPFWKDHFEAFLEGLK